MAISPCQGSRLAGAPWPEFVLVRAHLDGAHLAKDLIAFYRDLIAFYLLYRGLIAVYFVYRGPIAFYFIYRDPIVVHFCT
jgi:hypothetical protein